MQFDEVEIVRMPRFRVACVEHRGPLASLGQSQMKLINWRKQMGVSPSPAHRTYARFYSDPDTPSAANQIDLCVATDVPISPDSGLVEKWVSAGRYARIRHLGSREDIPAARWMMEQWLPQSEESMKRGQPLMFHFINVGPDLNQDDLKTDVYIPLAER